MRKRLLILMFFLLQMWLIPVYALAAPAVAAAKFLPPRTVTGTVYDAKGNTLPGVSVRIKGTTNGVVTDINGQFRISVPDNTTILVFSFVGYTSQEMQVGVQGQLNIKLEEANSQLNEVVVVGYGTQKKVNLTGSVSSVTFDEKITNRALTNMSTALSGLLPGVNVQQSTAVAGGSQANILVRGLTSPSSPTGPLVVVDGIPDTDGNLLNRIDPSDVDNVSVLKDAASAAAYGTRASTGVILITTKTGKGSKKPTINYKGNFSSLKPTNFYNYLTDYAMALTLHQRASRNGRNPSPVFSDGTVDEWLAQGMLDPVRFPNVNQLDWITQNGSISNNNVSAQGETENSNYFLSLGSYAEQGYMKNNDAKRYNLRSNVEYKIRKNVDIGARLDGNWTNQTFGLQNGFLDYSNGNPNVPLNVAIAGLLPYNEATQQYGGYMARGEANMAVNMLAEIEGRHNLIQRQEFNGTVYGSWRPVKGLTARVDYSLRYYNQFRKSYTDLGLDLYNFQTNTVAFTLFPAASNLSNSQLQGYKTLLQGRLDYAFEPWKGHNMSFLALASEEYRIDRNFGVSAGGRLGSNITELGNQTLAPLTNSFSGGSTDDGLQSALGRFNYTINDKYLFEALIRADGSSRFTEGHRWGYFPAVSAGWRFTEEKFLKGLTKIINSGKIRASWGKLGNNQGVGIYNQLQTLVSTPYIFNGNTLVSGVSANKQINQDFTWEATRATNIGLDLTFLNNRLAVEIDAYDKLTTNLIRPLALSTLLNGYDPPLYNIGTFRNNGIEANIRWSSKVRDINYGASFNFSYNIDRLEAWNQRLNFSKNYLQMPWFFAYYQKTYGLAQSWQDIYDAPFQNDANKAPGDILYKDLNGNGQVDSYDKFAEPNVNEQRPMCQYGLTLFGSWKGFNLSVLLQASTGRKDYFLEDATTQNIGLQRFNFQKLYLDQTWTYDNRNAIYPRLQSVNTAGNRTESDFWLQSMDYLRFKNVQLGYTVPAKFLKRFGIDRVQIYGTAENLFTITGWKGIDPEKSTLNNGQNNSFNDDPFPILKSYSFGLNVTF